MVKIIKILMENKEGIIIGGIIGYFLGKSVLLDMVDLSVIAQTQGIVDVVAGAGKSALELAKTKLIWASVAVGAVIGGYVDSLIPEGRFFK